MLLRLLAALLLAATVSGTAMAQQKFRVYIGTYTDSGSRGIYQCELNLADGSLSEPTLAAETPNPSFLAIHPNWRFLYAVNEAEATASAFAVDPTTGKLSFLNLQPTQGGAPCHLTVDPSGRNLLVANYGGGSCICLRIEPDGKLGPATSFHKHVGTRTHGHAIHVDKANRFAFCCDLGLDKVLIYAFDPDAGSLTPHGAFDTPRGAGPRHFAWHPDGTRAYINGETDLTLIACTYDAERGSLQQTQVLSTLPADVQRRGGSTAEVAVHPSGRFVYVSNRDPYNSIAIFSIDEQSGQLKPVGHQSMGIRTPRNFAIEPTGQYMLVANQSGDSVIVFRIDTTTGELVPTDHRIEVSRPVCVRYFVVP